MEKYICLALGFGTLLIASSSTAPAQIQPVSQTQAGICQDIAGGGGGEIPTPFDLNHRVELADGEEYLLVGRIDFLPLGAQESRPYFQPDFSVHPWLASAKRRLQPYYPLAAPYAQWFPYSGRTVKISSLAQGKIESDPMRGGLPEYQIELRLSPRGIIEMYDASFCSARRRHGRDSSQVFQRK